MSKVGKLLLSAHVCVFVFSELVSILKLLPGSPPVSSSPSLSLFLFPPIANTVSYGVVEGKTPSLSFILSRYFSFPGSFYMCFWPWPPVSALKSQWWISISCLFDLWHLEKKKKRLKLLLSFVLAFSFLFFIQWYFLSCRSQLIKVNSGIATEREPIHKQIIMFQYI